MLNLITSAEHAYATSARDLVALWKFLTQAVVPALKKADASAAVIEEVTGLVDPQAENVERAAFAVLGMLVHLIDQAGGADGPVNVQVPAALVAEIRAIGGALKGSSAFLKSAAPAAPAAK